MHANRLIRLAEILEADAVNPHGVKFDLGVWGVAIEGTVPAISCGTTACAVGLAILSGEFEQYGLKDYHNNAIAGVIMPYMRDSGRASFDAAAELFDISSRSTLYLFCDDFYDGGETTGAEGELAVAKRIRDFVETEST